MFGVQRVVTLGSKIRLFSQIARIVFGASMLETKGSP